MDDRDPARRTRRRAGQLKPGRLFERPRHRLAGTLLILAVMAMATGWVALFARADRESLYAGTALAFVAFALARTPSMLLYLVLALAAGWFPLLIFRPVESLLAIGAGVAVAVWWQRRLEDGGD